MGPLSSGLALPKRTVLVMKIVKTWCGYGWVGRKWPKTTFSLSVILERKSHKNKWLGFIHILKNEFMPVEGWREATSHTSSYMKSKRCSHNLKRNHRGGRFSSCATKARGDRNEGWDWISMFSQLATRSIHHLVNGFWTIMKQAIFSREIEATATMTTSDPTDSCGWAVKSTLSLEIFATR